VGAQLDGTSARDCYNGNQRAIDFRGRGRRQQDLADETNPSLHDIDRERTASAKLQKTSESERVEHVKSIDRLRAAFNTVQVERWRAT
jgi:hypothetical protein